MGNDDMNGFNRLKLDEISYLKRVREVSKFACQMREISSLPSDCPPIRRNEDVYSDMKIYDGDLPLEINNMKTHKNALTKQAVAEAKRVR